MNNELTLDLLTKYLGSPDKHYSYTYKWQCPYCLDSHRDNLIFNEEKGILWCFASDGEHSKKILSDIFKQEIKNNRLNLQAEFKRIRKKIRDNAEANNDKYSVIYEEEKQKEFIYYAAVNTIALMGNLEAQTMLLNKRGITKETAINVLLGYDEEKKKWVIPTIKYSTQYNTHLIGFEYRPLDFSKDKLSRERNTPTGLAQINEYNDQKNLVIVEGYFDGYALYQHLSEQDKIKDYHIVTCSNGVGGLLKQLSVVDFKKYQNCYLLIDNDETSIPVAQKICEQYPEITNLTPKMFKTCNCKDFNEHYLKCIYPTRISQKYNVEELKEIKNVNHLINYIKEKEAEIHTEFISKNYCLEKAKTDEEVILNFIKIFNNQYNKSVIAKILTGQFTKERLQRYGDKVMNSPYLGIFEISKYYSVQTTINNLIAKGLLATTQGRKWGKVYIVSNDTKL